ncbi:hypothetical protein [Actinomadura sp.]|jgi:serine/threonine-protein kinase|uniref:hypothetical protein n=1 Tax=Actinomadura sp. TaxID=1989 RepID=UPI0037CB6B5B
MSGVLVYLPAVPHHEAVRKELAPGDTLSFGRGTPCHNVGLHLDNPTVPRLAGEILAVDDHWRLSNFSTDRTYVVENPEGAGEYLRVAPRRAACPVPFEFSRVVLSTDGPANSFQVFASQHLYLDPDEHDMIEPDGSSTVSAFSLDERATYFLVLVALCEPRLRDESSTALPTSRQISERLADLPDRSLSLRAVNFHIDYLAERKLRVRQPYEEERQDGKRAAVVDTALRFGLVSEDHLSLLPDRRPTRP